MEGSSSATIGLGDFHRFSRRGLRHGPAEALWHPRCSRVIGPEWPTEITNQSESNRSQPSTPSSTVNKVQSSQLNSHLAVQKLLAMNSETVGSLPALDEAAQELTDFIVGINTNLQVQMAPSGAARAKRDAKLALGDAAFEIAGGVLALADATNDATLAARVKFSRTKVTSGSGNAVVARCQDILDAVTDNLKSLGGQGVTQAKLTALKAKLTAYDALRTMPRQATAASATATRQLAKLFPKVRNLLTNRVDRLVWQFRTSDPEFYEKYQVTRSIVDAPSPAQDEGSASAPQAKAA